MLRDDPFGGEREKCTSRGCSAPLSLDAFERRDCGELGAGRALLPALCGWRGPPRQWLPARGEGPFSSARCADGLSGGVPRGATCFAGGRGWKARATAAAASALASRCRGLGVGDLDLRGHRRASGDGVLSASSADRSSGSGFRGSGRVGCAWAALPSSASLGCLHHVRGDAAAAGEAPAAAAKACDSTALLAWSGRVVAAGRQLVLRAELGERA